MDAFFVRYHLTDIPEVDAAGWKLKVGGSAIEIGFDDLRRLPASEGRLVNRLCSLTAGPVVAGREILAGH